MLGRSLETDNRVIIPFIAGQHSAGSNSSLSLCPGCRRLRNRLRRSFRELQFSSPFRLVVHDHSCVCLGGSNALPVGLGIRPGSRGMADLPRR